jgi:glyoxylase-like metal-dependent hydrolase (beta-lactamase superfamily II)
VFDLGDRTVTFTLTPGHTSGSGCFFDSKTQYLFTGDMVSGCVLLIFAESDTVTKYRSSLDIIKKLQAKATKIYIGHSLDPVDPSTIDTLIQASDEIIKDSNVKLPLPFVKIKRSEQTVLILGWLCKVK